MLDEKRRDFQNILVGQSETSVKTKKLVIIGTGDFGEIASEYFRDDSEYEVVAFAVEREYRDTDQLFGLPVVDFEDIEKLYPPAEFCTFVAITYGQLNRVRRRIYESCKKMGYTCASYVSSRAFWGNHAEIGENSFVFEHNTIQYHVKIGNNVVLWSGNHVGHRTVIHDHCWICSHVVISGFCEIGESCFLGVNTALGNHLKVADDVVLAVNAGTVKDLTESIWVLQQSFQQGKLRTSNLV